MTRVLAALVASAAVLRAAARVAWLEPRSGLPDLVRRLRGPEGSKRSPTIVALDPRLVLAIVERLLPVLPPYGAGRCVKRSLVLLDVWSRAGLEPAFHVGVRGSGPERGGHAWVTTRDSAWATFQPPDVEETWCA
jgi:hypothetical protein